MQTVLVTGSGGHGAITPALTSNADIIVASLADLEAELVSNGRLTGENHHLG